MGKASSAKKVARAARAGGSAATDQRKLGYPIAIVAIIVLGVALVAFARTSQDSESVAPTLDDHWHYAYGIYTCDTWAAGLTDANPEQGIHTHDDGVIHIHPFSSAVSGKNATFGKFAEIVNLTVTDDSFTLPDGTTFTNGDDCGGKEGRVVMAVWPPDSPDADPVLFTDGFNDVRFTEDRGVLTLAFLPEEAEIPRPATVGNLDNLSDVPGSPGATVAPGAETEVPVSDPAGGDSTATTAAPQGAEGVDSTVAPEAGTDSTVTTSSSPAPADGGDGSSDTSAAP